MAAPEERRKRGGGEEEEEEGEKEEAKKRLDYVAYFYAVGNVTLDVVSATVTVAQHGLLTTADVNLLRFGFAGVVLTAAVAGRDHSPRCLFSHFLPSNLAVAPVLGGSDSSRSSSGNSGNGGGDEIGDESGDGQKLQKPASAMTQRDYCAVSAGVVFVTVLNPLIMTWVMFNLPLAVAMTLNSLTPIWSLPVAFFIFGEHISGLACAGAALACAGVVLLVVF